jgi:hypothetical protein
MKNLVQIQGKIIKVEPAKTGYYIVICEQETSKQQGAFSKWKPQEGYYMFTLRQDGRYFFVVNWQILAANLGKVNNVEVVQKKTIYQSYEAEDKQAEWQSIQEYQTKIKQLEVEVQQWKNAYYNQKSMLKKAQQNAQQCTVQAKIQAIQSKPGRKSKQDLDYLKLLTEFNTECKENWAWLNAD